MSKRKLLLANNPLLAGPKLQERTRRSEETSFHSFELPLDLIESDPDQPRREFDASRITELSESILLYGVLNPILVRESEIRGQYIIIAGERRYRAAKQAGLKTIPVVLSKQEAEGDILSVQLVENLQREDLNPLERAHAIALLKDNFDLSIREIAAKLGISKSMVQRSLELLKLPNDLQKALLAGASESKILVLAQIEDPDLRARYLEDIELLSRKQIQEEVSKQLGTPPSSRKSSKKLGLEYESPEDNRVAEEIQRALGLKVRLNRLQKGSEKGKLTIDFYNEADLQEIFRKLVGND